MSYIETGSAGADGEGGRTVYNSTVYGSRKVYEMTSLVKCDVVRSAWGTGEVEKTGEQVTEQRIYHVIATSEKLARSLFEQNWGSPFQRYTLTGVRVLFVLDGEIETKRS